MTGFDTLMWTTMDTLQGELAKSSFHNVLKSQGGVQEEGQAAPQ